MIDTVSSANDFPSRESTKDFSTYHRVPKLDKELFRWLHPKIAAHIEEVEGLAQYLLDKNKTLEAKISALDERLKKLETQLLKNSANSHKPPSSDSHFKKNQSLREKSAKKQGGQPGHKGSSLQRVSQPDFIEFHPIHNCNDCHSNLDEQYVIKSPDIFNSIGSGRLSDKTQGGVEYGKWNRQCCAQEKIEYLSIT